MKTEKSLTDEQVEELLKLFYAVDAFTEKMKLRLKEKLLEGFWGWDNPQEVSDNSLRTAILRDVKYMDLMEDYQKTTDIANRCMMLWFRSGGLKKSVEDK